MAQAVFIFIPGEITTGDKGSNPFLLFLFWLKKILYCVPVYFHRKENANQHIKGTLYWKMVCTSGKILLFIFMEETLLFCENFSKEDYCE